MNSSWSVLVKVLEEKISNLRRELKEIPCSGSLQETGSTERVVLKIGPTPAQKRRGAIHPVNCSCCGNTTFRRKGELKKSKVFFCQKTCRKAYQSS